MMTLFLIATSCIGAACAINTIAIIYMAKFHLSSHRLLKAEIAILKKRLGLK